MNEKFKNSSIIVFDDALGFYMDYEKIEKCVKNFGLKNFMDTYFINLNEIKSLLLDAKTNDLITRRLSSSSSQITFGQNYVYTSYHRNEQLENLLKSHGLKDKFYKIDVKNKIYYVQKIYSFDAIPNPVPWLSLPKPKVERVSKIII